MIEAVTRGGPAGHEDEGSFSLSRVPANSFASKVRRLLVEMRVRDGYRLDAQFARGHAVAFLRAEATSLSEIVAAVIAAQDIKGSHLFAGVLLSAAYEFSPEKDISYNLKSTVPLDIDFGHFSAAQSVIISQALHDAKVSGTATVVNDSCIDTLWRGYPYGLTINRGVINGVRRRKDNISQSCHMYDQGLIINMGKINNTVHGSLINFGQRMNYHDVKLEYLVDWYPEPYRQAKLPLGSFFENSTNHSIEIFIGKKRPSASAKACVRNMVIPPKFSALAQYLDELYAKLSQPALEITAYLRTLVPDPATYIKDHIFMLAKEFLPGGSS